MGRISPPLWRCIIILCTVTNREKYAPLKPVGWELDLSVPADNGSLADYFDPSEISIDGLSGRHPTIRPLRCTIRDHEELNPSGLQACDLVVTDPDPYWMN